MDIRIVDRSTPERLVCGLRGVSRDQDLFEVVRGLTKGANPATAQLRCDKDFYFALEDECLGRKNELLVSEADADWLAKLPSGATAMFDDIPIFVED